MCGEVIYLKNSNIILRPIRIFFITVLVFGLIYNVSFEFNTSITSGRVALIVVALLSFIMSFYKVFFLTSKVKLAISLPAILLFYSIFLYFNYNDYGVIARPLNLIIYSIIGGVLSSVLVGKLSIAIMTSLYAITVQSLIVIMSFVNTDFKLFLSSIIHIEANYDYSTYLYRGLGFSSASGAALSVVQSLGFLLIFIYLVLYKPSREIIYYFIISSFLMFLSVLITGRTGLMLSLFFIFLIILHNKVHNYFRNFHIIFFVALILFIGWAYLPSALPENFSIEYFSGWVSNAFTGEDGTIQALLSMPIPPMSHELIYGHGLVSLIDGSNPSGNDSGIVQFLYAYGLVFLIIFYLMYFMTLIKLTSYLPNLFSRLISLVFIFIEIKEPFLFKYSVFFVLVFLFCSYKLEFQFKNSKTRN